MMTEEKVAITIRLNKNIHAALKAYKKLTGLSINSQVYSAVAAWLFTKKLISLDTTNERTANNP